jgi:hypothetical protein
MTSFFLCEVYRVEQSTKAREALEAIRDFLIKNQGEEGGWSYENGLPEVLRPMIGYRPGMSFVTHTVTAALVMMRASGLEVEEEVFEKIRVYWGRLQNEDGGFPYYLLTEKQEERTQWAGQIQLDQSSAVGRTAGALWALHLLGQGGNGAFRKAKEYVGAHYEKAGNSQHGPAFHLFYTSLALQAVDGSLAGAFWHRLRDKIRAGQREDGSLAVQVPHFGEGKKWEEIDFSARPRAYLSQEVAYEPLDEDLWPGKAYATCFYALVLQLPKGNLLLSQVKPIR